MWGRSLRWTRWVLARLKRRVDEALETAEVRKEADLAVEEVRMMGGVTLTCGCFVSMKSEDLGFLTANVGPREMVRMIEDVKRGHIHPRKWRMAR